MKLDTGIVVETGGIGYDISVPGNSSLYLRSEGDEVICYTAMIVREDDVSLYGFAVLGLSLSMRFVIMSSARMTKKMIVARAYIFGVTVFFVML